MRASRATLICFACVLLCADAQRATAQYTLFVAQGEQQNLTFVATDTQSVTDTLSFAGFGGPSAVAVTPDGSSAYVLLGWDVAIVDVASRSIVADIMLYGDEPAEHIRMASDGRAYLTYGDAGDIAIIDTATRALSGHIHLPTVGDEGVDGLALSADGHFAYATSNGYDPGTGDDTGVFFVIDTSSGAIVSQIRLGNRAGAVAVDSESGRAYVAVPGAVATIDLSANLPATKLAVPGYVTALAAHGGALYAFTTQYGDTNIATLSVVRAGHSVKTVDFNGISGNLALTPSGATLYLTLAHSPQSIVALDTATEKVTASIEAVQDVGWPASLAVAAAVPVAPTPAATSGPSLPAATGYRVYGVSSGARALTTIDGSTGKTLQTLRFSGPSVGPASDLAISADGTTAYVTNAGVVHVVDTAPARVTATIATEDDYGIGGIGLSPDGGFAYVVNAALNRVEVMDTTSNRITASIDGLTDSYAYTIGSVRFSPTGDVAYVSYTQENDLGKGAVAVIDAHSLRVVADVPVGRAAYDMALSPDGETAYIAGGPVIVWDTRSRAVTAIIPAGGQARQLVLAPDGRLAYATVLDYRSGTAAIAVIDTVSKKVVDSIKLPGAGTAIAMQPDGRILYVGLGGPSTVLVMIDTATRQITGSAIGPASFNAIAVGAAPATTPTSVRTPAPTPTAVALHPCVYVAHHGGQPSSSALSVVDPARTALTGTVVVAPSSMDPWSGNTVSDAPRALAFSPDGRFVYVAIEPYFDGLGEVAVVDAAAGLKRDTIIAGCHPQALATSADGSRLFVASGGCCDHCSGGLAVIDVATHSMEDFIPLELSPNRLAFDSDRAVAYMAQFNPWDPKSANVLAVDVEARRVRASIDAGAPVVDVALTTDGRSLYAALANSGPPDYFNRLAIIDTASAQVRSTVAVPARGQAAAVALDSEGARAYIPILTAGASCSGYGCRPSAGTVICDGYDCHDAEATVAVVDTATELMVASIPFSGYPEDAVITAGGEQLFVTDSVNGVLHVFDTQSEQALDAITLADAPGSIAAGMSAGCSATVALTPLPTRTPTPTWTSLPTDTPRPTRASPASPTPGQATPLAPAPPNGGRLVVETVAGMRGEDVTFSVRLDTERNEVVGVQNDLSFDPNVLALSLGGDQPRCRVNSDLNKGGFFRLLPSGDLRAIILSLSDTDAIPGGSVLYACTVRVAADAPLGLSALEITDALASDPLGNPLSLTTTRGAIAIVAQATPTAISATAAAAASPALAAGGAHPQPGSAATVSAATGGGCSVSPPIEQRGSAFWLTPLLALLLLLKPCGRGLPERRVARTRAPFSRRT
jgi:DNA-binding beta-propeller fold protein YncE